MFGWLKRKPREPRNIDVGKGLIEVETDDGKIHETAFEGTAKWVDSSATISGSGFLSVRTARQMFALWRMTVGTEGLVGVGNEDSTVWFPMHRIMAIRVKFEPHTVTV